MGNRKIEYVFGPPRPRTGHSLGVTALALGGTPLGLQSYATLVSGGRDGRLNAWALGPQATQAVRVSDAHTNWVTDIVLHGHAVVSSSADTTVKIWNLTDNHVSTVGHHTDYAQCLALLDTNTVVSGGLDGRLLGWDLAIGKSAFEIQAPHSVYSLTGVPTQSPHTLVAGTHDGTVSVWDVRQPQAAAVFRGHTDNVRCLHAVDADTVLSGSSDATVKVWSLRAGRLSHSLTNFRSSVWSLWPTPDETGFWAGDRDGNLYHSPHLEEPTVHENLAPPGVQGLCQDPTTGNLWISTPFSPDLTCVNPQQGSTVEVLQGHSGLRKHRLLNEKRHALVLDTKGKIGMVDLVSAKPVENFERWIDPDTSDVDAELDKVLEEVNTMDVLDNWCQVQIRTGEICVTLDHRSVNNTEVYLDDLHLHVDKVKRTPMPTPATSPVGTPATSPRMTPQNSGFFRQGRSPFTSPAVSRVTSTQSMLSLSRATPKAAGAPGPLTSGGHLGTGKGHAKFYDPDDDEGGSASSPKGPAPPMPQPPPPTTPVPKVQLNADETEEPADQNTVDDEICINLGNFVLGNLLRGVTERLRKEYDDMPPPPPSTLPSTPAHSTRAESISPAASKQTADSTTSSAKPERRRTRIFNKLFGRKRDEEDSAGGSPPGSAASSSANSKAPAHHHHHHHEETSPQVVKQKHQQHQQGLPDSASFLEAWSRAVADHCLESADPEAPLPDVLSRRARVVISEMAPGAGAATEIYSTTVGRLISSKQEAEQIERLLPGWVGDALLLGKLNLKSPSKIGFAVHPGEEGLPVLTPETTRLMAISMLRMRKIMNYTVGQLQEQGVLSAEASKYAPEDIVQLFCQGTELSALVTLGTVRTRIWRKGGDVSMEYRLKMKV